MNDEVAQWTDFFNKMFDEARRLIYERYKVEANGSGHPEVLAIRKAASSFPCPVRIAEIKIDLEKHKNMNIELRQVIRYDFSELGVTKGAIEYYGVVDENDSEKLKELLVTKFDWSFSFDEFKDLRTIGWSDDELKRVVQFPMYDIRDNFREFIGDFLFHAFNPFASEEIRKIAKGIDWNKKFDLEPDPIFPLFELTTMDRTLSAFLAFSEGGDIDRLQQDICNIQLVPTVPEEVKIVFQRAKNLYIYGFFRYSFFTIARHYAYLALESAIKNSYYQSFGNNIVLANKKEGGEKIKFNRINHQIVIDFCRGRTGWNCNRLWINGEKFAFKSDELLDWHVRNGIITLWQRRLCNRGIRQRNLTSHLTNPSIFPPSYSIEALELVADMINRLFSDRNQ